MKIYIVFGTTGEYSDRNEWPVIAYLDEKKAQKHVLKATERAKEIQVNRKNIFSAIKEINEHDKDMQMDYTGTMYYYESTEIADYK